MAGPTTQEHGESQAQAVAEGHRQGSVSVSMAYITDREPGATAGDHMAIPGSCTELALLITGCGTLESWPHLSPSATLDRMGE